RNNGDGTFTNWSREAGILIEGFGLGIALCDINQDNWIDVYCSNDFISSDLLWINNQDGTFTEKAGEYFKHFTNNGMGMDIADYNNDGLLDVMVLDMMPVTNVRQKLMFAYRNMDRLNEAIAEGYLPQFMRNTLQLNLGKFPDGHFRFSEISFLAGIYQTDWSWSPLLVDFDNDGWKDLLITNGYRKDVTNLDYINDIIRETRFGSDESKHLFLVNSLNKLADVKIPNYIFRNNRDLTFEDKSRDWGLDIPTFSNGTITADLDNDGDLDIVVNNIDQEVYLYENLLNEKKIDTNQNHFLTIRFDQQITESDKIGSKIWIFQQGNNQYFEYSPYRGYKSTIDQDIHVGVGSSILIDSMIIQWPDGTVQQSTEVKCDSIFVISRSKALSFYDGSFISQFNREQEELIFNDITDSLQLDIKHVESKYNDFRRTPSLIRSLSKNGPSISIGDVNQDGLDDVFLGNDKNRKPSIFIQGTNQTFSQLNIDLDSLPEDMGSLLFDADGDKDLDLYVVSGGSSWKEGATAYQDRLYFNDGSGYFKLKSEALPEISTSGSCVIASDFDGDGDLDLFVGGRLVPNKYPSSPQSYLLENVDGRFRDKSVKLGENHGLLGMVTSALWTDVNNDNAPDLMVVGEWMQITVLLNTGSSFIDRTDVFNLSNSNGWWNSINGGDFDNDGDIDYLVGNYGLNSFYKASPDEPLEIYAKDFDRNGTFDPIMTNYILGESYIIHPRNTINQLIPSLANRFMTYESYGNTPFNQSFTSQELEGAIHLKCKMMQSIILENVDGISFEVHDLPFEAQFSPIFGTALDDFNNDNRLDIMIIGNSMADESIAGYYDASYGNILINKGDFNWEVLPPSKTNFIADGDKKALAKIVVGNNPVYLMTENDGYLQAYTYPLLDYKVIKLLDEDWYYSLDQKGLQRKVELYSGSGYLSSSSRSICLQAGIDELTIFNYQGNSRMVSLVE
ncbi:MAG: VCBS repeat-containing protein, partial [Cyclobacteriaceae bacterium]|nr:VCBS repeat-containing protein [Cyclobacteriaceae bacterium]